MPEPTLSMTLDDDLPRTLRREREARERAARERGAAGPQLMTLEVVDEGFAPPAPAATVTGFDVPFGKLVMFFFKATLAAIPALLMLTVLAWAFGQALQTFFPALLKMKILIYVPPQ